MEILKLPVGIENFEDIRRSGFYYIDKTMLIEQTLNNWSKVTLFTRPRRFGKDSWHEHAALIFRDWHGQITV